MCAWFGGWNGIAGTTEWSLSSLEGGTEVFTCYLLTTCYLLLVDNLAGTSQDEPKTAASMCCYVQTNFDAPPPQQRGLGSMIFKPYPGQNDGRREILQLARMIETTR